MGATKDWDSMVSLFWDLNYARFLTDDDTTNLGRILFASIRKAVGERIVPSSDNPEQDDNSAQRELYESRREAITKAMVGNYLRLVAKVWNEKLKMPSVVEIIFYFDWECFSKDETLDEYIPFFSEAFFEKEEQEALRSCLRTLNFFLSKGGELKGLAEEYLNSIEIQLVENLKSDMKKGDTGNVHLVSLKRLYELQLSKSVPLEGLFEDFAIFLGKADKEVLSKYTQVASFMLLNMYLHVGWSLDDVVNSQHPSE